MPDPDLMKLIPGSEKAKEHGCVCTIQDKKSYVSENCPLHWPMMVIYNNSLTRDFIFNATSEIKNLYKILITLIIFVIILIFMRT